MSTSTAASAASPAAENGLLRVALLGNPNTGKTTLFNRLCGLRHKTSNFPGTTQEARIGFLDAPDEGDKPAAAHVELVDLPGIYSLELDQSEAAICRRVLDGTLAPPGHEVAAPDAVCIVVDSTNLARNLLLVGEAMRRRLPTIVALNMIDLVDRRGVVIDAPALEERIGCHVVPCSARTGHGLDALTAALPHARIPNHTPPGTQEGLEEWADALYEQVSSATHAPQHAARRDAAARFTDRLDRVFTHPLMGVLVFGAVMFALFWTIFSLATYPMDWIDAIFNGNSAWVAAWQPEFLRRLVEGGLTGLVQWIMPEGILRDFLSKGVVSGIGATVIFLPQICILFFLISLLEDTGYLARAAFVMDRVLRPFGLSGHAFVPLLSSHACALPGIMACRAIPDRRDRLAAILVAPFMSCSARIPVYVLLTVLLFRDSPLKQALAFSACYIAGILAGLVSALIARRTILRGAGRAMALELPTYKFPSIRTALLTTYDRAVIFLKKAGTNILAIVIVLWWLSSYPQVDPPAQAVELRASVDGLADGDIAPTSPDMHGDPALSTAGDVRSEADHIEARHALEHSFAGRMGKFIQPAFAPLGYDWQLSIGVVTSFAAREVFVSTMAVIVTGSEEADEGVMEQIATARRSDGVTPIFTIATSWSLLIYYVLAMQCLPTLVVTAREAGGAKWALLQLLWMCGLAYAAALLIFQCCRLAGIA